MLTVFILRTQSPHEHYTGEAKQHKHEQLKDRHLTLSEKHYFTKLCHLGPLSFDTLTHKTHKTIFGT